MPSAANSCTCSGTLNYDTGNGAPITYNITDYSNSTIASGSSPNGIFTINGLCPEVYLISVTESGITTGNVFNISTTTINPGDAIEMTICSTDPNVNFNNDIVGIAPGGTWTNPGFQNQPFPAAANSMTSGWYLYSIPSGGCEVITGVYVDYLVNADPGTSATYLICENYLPFDMVNFLSGNPDPTGQWFDELVNPMNGTYDPATMNEGSFTYMVDNVPGCGPVFAVLTVIENQIPDPGTNTSILVCENGIPFNLYNHLGGTPDPGGQWFNPLNVPVSGTFNPSTYIAGNYRYHVNGLTPCIDANAFVNVTFIADNPSGESADVTICENGSNLNMLNALNGNPLSGGTWTNTQGQTVDGTFNPQTETPGNYTYYYPNVGCSPQNVELSISIEELPNAGNNNNVSVCESISAINLNGLLSVGADLGGSWTDENNNTVSNNFIPDDNDNNYTFVYHVNGAVCPDDLATIGINLEPLPSDPPATNLSFCSEDNAVDLHDYYPTFPDIGFETPAGMVTAAIFDPSTNDDTDIIAVEYSGNSCPNGEGLITIEVTQPLFEVSNLTYDVCQSDQFFNLETTDPDANSAMGTWFDEDGNSIVSNVDLDFTGVRAYLFVADDGGNCGGSELNVALNVFESVDAGPGNSATFCETDSPENLSILLPVSVSGAGSWSLNGQPFSSNQINPATDASGSYIYTLPANGPCPSDGTELTVSIQQSIPLNAGNDTDVCADGNNVVLGGNSLPGVTYSWSPSTNLTSANVSQPTVIIPSEVNSSISVVYEVVATDGVCTSIDEVAVNIYPLPVISIGDEYSICFGESLTLSVSQPGEYQWSPGYLFENPILPSQTFTSNDDVEVSVNFIDSNGCQTSDNAIVVVNPMPYVVTDPQPAESCPPLVTEYYIDESSQNVSTINWVIPGIGNFEGDTLNTSIYETGVYSLELIAISEFGCVTTLQFPNFMEVFELPVAGFHSFPDEISTVNPIAEFIDESYGAISYYWNFHNLGTSTDPEPVFEFPNNEPANFLVCQTVTNEFGCIDSSCSYIRLDNEYILYAPNAMTPDGDGINDIFSPVMLGFDETTYTLQIFDRWGDLIFSTNEYGKPWLGDVNGGTHFAKDDVYVWQVKVKDMENAEYRVFRGSLTLIR